MFRNKEEPLKIDRRIWDQLREFKKAPYREKYNKKVEEYQELY
ncbi:MAG: hypothetical protein BAJALOKI3v1_40009 [Promethearchaeota archaeon]|jgi:hypothetical protein|nr:MAG: hypothetical protein BAJALOKI3v1_40009 [Candidatus Lokiarchaeota archaeon]